MKTKKYEVKYYATVEEVIKKSSSRTVRLTSFYLARGHVKNYLGGKPAQIWILRVYELDESSICLDFVECYMPMSILW